MKDHSAETIKLSFATDYILKSLAIFTSGLPISPNLHAIFIIGDGGFTQTGAIVSATYGCLYFIRRFER